MIISFLTGTMLPISVLISIVLMILGVRRNIKYLNSKIPLGRTLYAVGNVSSFLLWLGSLYMLSYVMKVDSIVSSLGYLLIAYLFAIIGFTFYFITGMRRAYDIGFPFWAYPVYLFIVLVSRYISPELSNFLVLGLWILLLQPSDRR